MANVGFVYRDWYENKATKEKVETIILDFRTISIRKQFTMAVNKLKFPEGKIGTKIAEGKEDHPDYHIWANFSNRGESLPSQIIGNIKNAVSERGVKYKRGHIFDPFLSRHKIYFTLFEVEKEKRMHENHFYNIIADAYVPRTAGNNAQAYQGTAIPTYDNEDMWAGADGAMTTSDGRNIPVYNESVATDAIPSDEEMPF